MNIQLYYSKMNFDVQKAKRFLKERRIPFTEVDLKKHKLGMRELELFARAAGGMKALVDADAKGERADYVRQLSIDSYIAEELLANPSLIKGPIVRNGSAATVGFEQAVVEKWLTANK